MVYNATFNNISVISSVLLVEETGVPGEKHRPVASHWQTLSHNVVHLALIGIRNHNISGDRQRLHRITTIRSRSWRRLINQGFYNIILDIIWLTYALVSLINCNYNVIVQYIILYNFSRQQYFCWYTYVWNVTKVKCEAKCCDGWTIDENGQCSVRMYFSFSFFL